MNQEKLEKKLRRIEVKRLWQNPGDLTAAELASTSLEFMSLSDRSGDYRFLNAALKLNDYLRANAPKEIDLATLERTESETLAGLERKLGLRK